MSAYRLTEAAETDLDGIFDHTEQQWGSAQAHRYLSQLSECAEALAREWGRVGNGVKGYRGLRRLHCQHHYLFAVKHDDQPISIVAVLYERMDLMTRLAERLG
jgi:toxin ParE1/3/4